MASLPAFESSSPISVPAPVRTEQMAASQVPRHPQYADVIARVQSFDGKVIPRGQDVQELAGAGFYHVGKKMSLASVGCPDDLRSVSSLTSFRHSLKTQLSSKTFY